MRWSVTLFWGKLYVLIRSLRSPVPTCDLRRLSTFCRCSSSIRSLSRARSTRMALSLFLCWLFSSWQVTTIPVGRWVIRTAD